MGESNDSDLALSARVRDGDAEAFAVLVETYFTDCIRFAVSFVQQQDAAEDVVQDVLVRLWQQRSRMPTTGSVRAFLFAAIRNKALDMLKHQSAGDRARQAMVHEIPQSLSPVEHIVADADAEEQHRLLAQVHAAIRSLPERQQTALALRYGQGLRVADIGEVLGISTKAAEQVVFRALRTLKAEFKS